MGKKAKPITLVMVFFIIGFHLIFAEEFPIITGPGKTISFAFATDGNNYFIPIIGNASDPSAVMGQFLDGAGNPFGALVSLNDQAVGMTIRATFDGSAYREFWCTSSGELKMQKIALDGSLIGTPVTIATRISQTRPNFALAVADDHTSLVVYVRDDGFVFGQLLASDGTLNGNPFQISSNPARELTVAYGGNQFLVAWVDDVMDKDISGQFVSKNGQLIGSNFIIDNGPNYSDNPLSLASDGNRFILTYHEAPDLDSNWTLVGAVISSPGVVNSTFTICLPEKDPFLPSIACDGTNFLIIWTQRADSTLQGQFYDQSGQPVDAPFVIMPPTNGKIPIGGIGFDGSKFLVIATKMTGDFSEGDIYGAFLSSPANIHENEPNAAHNFSLYQNYPNPFNPVTIITFYLPVPGDISLSVYNGLGREVATLWKGYQKSGMHTLVFDGTNLPSGVYFYTLKTGTTTLTRKMILVK